MLDSMGEVNGGVETVLTEQAFSCFYDFVLSIWGVPAAEFFQGGWTQREDGSLVVSFKGNFGETFKTNLWNPTVNPVLE